VDIFGNTSSLALYAGERQGDNSVSSERFKRIERGNPLADHVKRRISGDDNQLNLAREGESNIMPISSFQSHIKKFMKQLDTGVYSEIQIVNNIPDQYHGEILQRLKDGEDFAQIIKDVIDKEVKKYSDIEFRYSEFAKSDIVPGIEGYPDNQVKSSLFQDGSSILFRP